jgi:small subunit ribosomal protein S8e
MAISQRRPRRKPTGARYKDFRKKRLSEQGRDPTFTKVDPLRKIVLRTLGANTKSKILSTDIANVFNPKTKKYTVSKIKTVSDNPANKNYIRRNIITKGAIIVTEAGKARVTSRPGQEGTLNAVLIE